MADKNVTIIEPVASDVKALVAVFQDGQLQSVEATIFLRSSDETVPTQAKNCQCLSDELSGSAQSALDALLSEVLANAKTKLGF